MTQPCSTHETGSPRESPAVPVSKVTRLTWGTSICLKSKCLSWRRPSARLMRSGHGVSPCTGSCRLSSTSCPTAVGACISVRMRAWTDAMWWSTTPHVSKRSSAFATQSSSSALQIVRHATGENLTLPSTLHSRHSMWPKSCARNLARPSVDLKRRWSMPTMRNELLTCSRKTRTRL